MDGQQKADEESINQVIDFIGDKDKAKKAVEATVQYEENNPCDEECSRYDHSSHGKSCWKPGKDVPMSPYYIGAIKNSVLTDVICDTNNHTRLSLANFEACKEAIEEIEDKPEEQSDEWAEQKVSERNTTISEVLDEVEVSEEDRERIVDIVENNDALEYWYDYIAPSIKHREFPKKAILIMLASPRDKHGNKGRINVFMYGEAGTGKSGFKSFLKKEFDAVTIDGPRVSEPDLTMNKKSGDLGKLPQAHKGILVVEEADEMDGELLGSTLTSFGETGRIEIRDMEIPAKAKGVMLSNFESKREIISQWSPESLDRFDFTIHFERLDDDEKSDTLDWHYKHFRKPNPNENKDILKKYIKIVREHTPDIVEPEQIKQFKEDNISHIDNIREGISIMNVAWTIARLNLDDVKLEHYKKAYNLVVKDKSLADKF